MVMQKQLIRSIVAAALALLLMSVIGGPVYATGYGDYMESGSPEYLYYIEGTGAYLLPDADWDIFFSLGKWYRLSEGSWSMSDHFDGPWSGITAGSLPKDLAELPADFRETHKLGMIPYRYVVGKDHRDDRDGYWYYKGRYYDDYKRHGYRRRWHPHGKFWFFVAPDFHDDWDDDWDDSHRRRRRGGRY
jgi:hypothetical protein